MRSLLQRIRRALCSHRCHLYRFDGLPNIHRASDGMVEARCYKCGAILRADYGLALPGFKMGTEPRPPR